LPNLKQKILKILDANTHINNPLTIGSYGSLNNLAKAGQDAPFNFSEDQNKDAKATKAKEYQEELQRQVREKQMQKQREKDEQERLDKKMLADIASYNPYGRAGGGAPIKDKEGNTVADLSQVKADPSQYSPRDLPSQQQQQQKPSFNFNPNSGFGPSSPNTFAPFNNSSFLTPSQQAQQQQQPNFLNSSRGNAPPGEDQKFARGGNGIFGEAKSDDQKKQEEKYKMELQRQIEDKKRQKELEKERERMEDEKEYKRIMEQQERIKAELEEELRKKKEKEQVGQRLNDDAKKLADERKKQDNRQPAPPKQRNVTKPTRKINKANSSDDFGLSEAGASSPQPPQVEFRTNSPPVPAAAKKLNGGGGGGGVGGGGGKAPAGNVANSPLPPPPKPNNVPKKKANATADYYVTESRLNLASPVSFWHGFLFLTLRRVFCFFLFFK
jgi:centrosome and spindle pole-associated protein 1